MKCFTSLLLFTALFACHQPAEKQLPLVGTWQLISATSTEKDSTYSTFEARNKMIKIITPTHLAFFNYDLNMGKDSTTAAYSGGGGTYTLQGDQYTEHLEYFNYREWEGHTFDFTVTIKNDTLTQRGVEKLEKLGIDRIIEERYKRL